LARKIRSQDEKKGRGGIESREVYDEAKATSSAPICEGEKQPGGRIKGESRTENDLLREVGCQGGETKIYNAEKKCNLIGKEIIVRKGTPYQPEKCAGRPEGAPSVKKNGVGF